MNTSEITPVVALVDRISTAELLKRYGLQSRTGLANRMDALGISPYKDGKQFYVSLEELERLDALHRCLQQGKKLSECAALISNTLSVTHQEITEHQLEPNPLLANTITSPLIIQMTPADDPIAKAEQMRRILREAAEHTDVLPTSELLPLLGLQSIPKLNAGKFERRGFIFERMPKTQREAEWRIKKL